MAHLVREDVQRLQEAGVAGREREGPLPVAGHGGHVDPALEAGRAAEDLGPRAADRLADALDVVAPEEVERGGVARLELEVREDDEEVVGVRVRRVEAEADAGAGLVVQRPVGQAVVVGGAVVLDDRDLTGVTVDPGVGQRLERGLDRAQADGGPPQLLGGLRLEGGSGQGEKREEKRDAEPGAEQTAGGRVPRCRSTAAPDTRARPPA